MHATRVRIVGRGNKLWKTGWTLFVKRVTIGHPAINHQISVLGMKVRVETTNPLSTWAEQMAIDVHKLHWLVTVQECMCIGRDTRLKTRYKFVEFRRHPSRDRAPTDDEKHALEEYRSLEKKRERKREKER